MDREEKIKAITDLSAEQIGLIKKTIRIAKAKPAKRATTAIVRAWKVVNLVIQVRQLEAQKHIIAAIPNQKHEFKKGGITASVGNVDSPEIILRK